MSIVESNRKRLESLGEYVTRANVDWFAVFPEKRENQRNLAIKQGRNDHNLVAYRTRSENPREHYVIPFSILEDLLADSALTHSDVNDTIRWNVTIKNNHLHVSHSDVSVDVSQYFALPLLTDGDTWESNWQEVVVATDIEPPEKTRTATVVYRILRNTAMAQKVKRAHQFRCQICNFEIRLPDGSRYAEAHHIQPLGGIHDGPDIPENILVLCPNHHAMCDYGVMKLAIDDLGVLPSHTVGREFIEYHNTMIAECGRGRLDSP